LCARWNARIVALSHRVTQLVAQPFTGIIGVDMGVHWMSNGFARNVTLPKTLA
jgi:hypothetical protein